MQIKINKKTWDAFGEDLEKFNVKERDFSFQTYIHISLHAYTSEALGRMLKLFESNPKAYAAKTIARDIKLWIEISTNAKAAIAAKGRTMEQACTFLIEFIRTNPRRHIYKRIQEGGEGVVLAYYVTEVTYHEARQDSSGYTIPQFTHVTLAYEMFGSIRTTGFDLYSSGMIGKTPADMLFAAGYTLETVSVRGDYEYYVEEYMKIKDQIGTQYLAVGVADDTGIDGNPHSNTWYYSTSTANVRLDKDGNPTRVVVDVFREEEKDRDDKDARYSNYFWSTESRQNKTRAKKIIEEGDEEYDKDAVTEEDLQQIQIPIHPYVACFDLQRHRRLKIHVQNLTRYVYNTKIRESLILPTEHGKILDVLLVEKESHFRDIIKGKSGGIMIMCQGEPGTGKTLTAEIYAESLERPLYTIQCSQLGIKLDALEDNLMKVLARGRRWGAVMLLDEADVYVTARGKDLTQNAIVGVFLRVLEYHSGVMFFTTNRSDQIDDAILSRCTARIPYGVPEVEDQRRIWQVLCEANGVTITPEDLEDLIFDHDNLSGRDIKNLLKLAMMVAHDRGCKITSDLITELRIFRPTTKV